jgi:hypothetical protein
VTLLDAIADPQLFARYFASMSWWAWHVLLAAVSAEPLDDEGLALYRRCTGRQHPPSRPVREAWLPVGRRGGKSRIVALVAVYVAAFRRHALAPGEAGVVQVIAADRSQARVVLRYARALFEEVPLLRPLVARRTRETIELTNGISVEVTTANIRAPRGRTVVAAILDEVAYWWNDEHSANPDAEVIAAVRPSMATIPDALLLAISSPYARAGVLYDMYRRYYGVDDPRVLVWQADTRTMNPCVDEAVIAEAYERDPESARAEYGGEFRDDLQAFLSIEQVRQVTVPGREVLPPRPRRDYLAFVDPAGGTGRDAMTAAVAHREGAKVVLDLVLRVTPPFSPARVVAEFVAALRPYGVGVVHGDRYAASWCTERFAAHGMHYEPAPLTRSQLYLAFAPMVLSEEVALLDHPRLTRELCALERRPRRAGQDAVDHAPRAHDDLANAVAGAAVLVQLGRAKTFEYRRASGV